MALVDDYVVVVDLAAANDGLVTRPQLLAEGVSPTSIARLTRTPRALSSLGAGVYLVPALEDMRFGPFKVALQRLSPERFLSQIAGDPLGERGGVLSHHAAAELHGAPDLPQEMHVTVPRRRRVGGMTLHTATLAPDDVVMVEGMPVTSVERTTYDLGRWPMDGEHRSRWVDLCIDEGWLTYERAAELLGPSAEETLMYLPMAS